MRKKIIGRISLYLFVFLLLCTFASIQVQKMTLPQVEVSDPAPGTVAVDGTETPYDYTLPLSALEAEGEDYYVYYLQEFEGRFGKEQSVMRMGVRVEAQDGVTAALTSPGYGKTVVRTNKPLEDGMRVMVSSPNE